MPYGIRIKLELVHARLGGVKPNSGLLAEQKKYHEGGAARAMEGKVRPGQAERHPPGGWPASPPSKL
jgi:hypothetical protein